MSIVKQSSLMSREGGKNKLFFRLKGFNECDANFAKRDSIVPLFPYKNSQFVVDGFLILVFIDVRFWILFLL